MEKMLTEKSSPSHLFQLSFFKPKTHSSVEVLPQMPPRQLSLFLEQAMSQKLHVAVQLNPESKKEPIREHTGIPRVSSHTNQFFILEDKKTLYLCPFSLVRHIRLVK